MSEKDQTARPVRLRGRFVFHVRFGSVGVAVQRREATPVFDGTQGEVVHITNR